MRISSRSIVFLLLSAAGLILAIVWVVGGLKSPFTFGSRPSQNTNSLDRDATGLPLAEAAASADPNLRIPPSPAEIARGATIKGRVKHEPAGEPLPADLVVQLRPARFHKNKERAVSKDLKVNARGEFTAEALPYAAYELRATAAGWSGVASELNILQTAPYVNVNIRIIKNPKLSGSVRDTMRVPVSAMRVELAGRDEIGTVVRKDTNTDGAGMFHFEDVPDGDYTVTVGDVNHPLRTPLTIQVREGVAPSVAIDIPVPASIAARAFVPGYDVPVEGVSVLMFRASDLGSATESIVTGNDGKATFKNLPPGKYIIRATREYFKSVDAAVNLAEGQFETVDLGMEPMLEELIQQLELSNPPPVK
ncbi:MAG: collagen binding domain-containing protein [Planctomycetota bacterium]